MRHVLLVTVDTLRADRLGCHGNERSLTPGLDALAEQGVRFDQAYAPVPQTSPSHASLFTGRYPLDHGLSSNMNRIGMEVVTLAELFKDHGFATGAFYHIFPFHQAKLTQGFEKRHHDQSARADTIDAAFDAFLDQREGEALFLWVHLFVVHSPLDPLAEDLHLVEHPYDGELTHDFRVLNGIRSGEIEAPAEFLENYADLYDAEVAHADRRVQALLGALSRRDLLEETLVVFTADHGERLEDGIVGLHAPYLLETTLHVPLIMTGPGLPPGTVVAETVELIDVFSTILEAVDLPVPEGVASQSLSPLVRGEAVGWSGAAFATLPGEYLGRVGLQGADESASSVIRDSMMFIRHSGGSSDLRDLRLDYPDRSVHHPDHAALSAELGVELERWVQSVPSGLAGGRVDADTRRLLQQLGYEDGEEPEDDGESTGTKDTEGRGGWD